MPALSVIDQRVGLDRQPAPLPQSPIYVSPNDPSSSHVGSHAYFIPPIYFDRHYLPNLPIHAHAEGGMSPSAALNYLSVPVASGPWSAHVQQNPYPLPPLPPPQTPHKVWILDCRTCGTFLTNRGMKVGHLQFLLSVRGTFLTHRTLGCIVAKTQRLSFLH